MTPAAIALLVLYCWGALLTFWMVIKKEAPLMAGLLFALLWPIALPVLVEEFS